ncbi:MAG: hypothetical protein ACW99G_06145 [Candidatus Thorarchaeota archaeon]|jgi:hypothetical protein
MNIDLTEQDIKNLQIAVTSMAKSAQADVPAMKVLMILHDKLDKSLPKEVAEDFTSKEFQEAAAEQHTQTLAEKNAAKSE